MQPWQWQRFTCGMSVAGGTFGDQQQGLARVRGTRERNPRRCRRGVDRDRPRLAPREHGDHPRLARPRRVRSASHPDDPDPAGRRRVPGRRGRVRRLSAVRRALVRLAFVLDREAGGEQLAQRLEREIPTSEVITHSQKAGPMCLAAQRLAEAISAHRIRHPTTRGSPGTSSAPRLSGSARSSGSPSPAARRGRRSTPTCYKMRPIRCRTGVRRRSCSR